MLFRSDALEALLQLLVELHDRFDQGLLVGFVVQKDGKDICKKLHHGLAIFDSNRRLGVQEFVHVGEDNLTLT